jgi:hypothetical protein
MGRWNSAFDELKAMQRPEVQVKRGWCTQNWKSNTVWAVEVSAAQFDGTKAFLDLTDTWKFARIKTRTSL